MNANDSSAPRLNVNEQNLSDTAKMCQDLVAVIFGFDAAITLLSDDRVLNLIPDILPGKFVSVGSLVDRDGTIGAEYHFNYYLHQLRTEPRYWEGTKAIWASSCLIRLGDRLTHHGYFDRSPDLELIRHLRNAVAHNDKFRIDSLKKLHQYPAHLTAGQRNWKIDFAMNGRPLYDLFSVSDICSIVQNVGIELNNRALKRHVTT